MQLVTQGEDPTAWAQDARLDLGSASLFFPGRPGTALLGWWPTLSFFSPDERPRLDDTTPGLQRWMIRLAIQGARLFRFLEGAGFWCSPRSMGNKLVRHYGRGHRQEYRNTNAMSRAHSTVEGIARKKYVHADPRSRFGSCQPSVNFQ